MVSDAAGFDVREAKKNRGLRLLSTQERKIWYTGASRSSQCCSRTKIVAAVPSIEDITETTSVKGYQETNNHFAG